MTIRIFSLVLLGMLIGTSVSSQTFMCPNGVRTIVNELPYDINTVTNEITFQLGCDPCTFENGDTDNCECHATCDEDHDECRKVCIENFNGITQFADCIETCRMHSVWCKDACGDFIEPIRTAESFGVFYQLWWTHGLVASMKGDPDETFISGVINGEPGNFVHLTSEDFMGESISFCINYQVFIQYDDGTCCEFIGSECFHKG